MKILVQDQSVGKKLLRATKKDIYGIDFSPPTLRLSQTTFFQGSLCFYDMISGSFQADRKGSPKSLWTPNIAQTVAATSAKLALIPRSTGVLPRW